MDEPTCVFEFPFRSLTCLGWSGSHDRRGAGGSAMTVCSGRCPHVHICFRPESGSERARVFCQRELCAANAVDLENPKTTIQLKTASVTCNGRRR